MFIKNPQPQSSFLSIDKDMNIIIDKMLKNERLKRLLYYTTKDALEKPNLTEDQTLDLIGKNIKNVPKLYTDKEVLNYIIINFNDFIPSQNPEFRDNTIEFDIICHFDQWQLKDFALRPYRIAAEIDSIFNKARLTGIGKLEFVTCYEIVMDDECAGICLKYRAIHGGEDKKGMPNPKDEERFQQDWKDMNEAD